MANKLPIKNSCRFVLVAAFASLIFFAESALCSGDTSSRLVPKSIEFVELVSRAISQIDTDSSTRVNKGESTVNGLTFAMQAIATDISSEELCQKLRGVLGSRALVAMHHTNLSDIIVVTPTDISNKMESIKLAYVISVMNLPGGTRMGVGSPAGSLLAATLREPVLTATWISQCRRSLKAALSSSHRFAGTSSLQELSTCEKSIFHCRMDLVADLRSDGFIPVNPDERVDSESNGVLANADTEYTGVWQKGRTTVYLNITKKSQVASSEVGVYEVTTK